MSEIKKTYTLSDFRDAGIEKFVRDLASPIQDKWDENAQKENVQYLTPVKYIKPPSCPFPFDDAIKEERIFFPSIEEWIKCPDNKRVEMYHKAVDDFEAYREDYNKRVDEKGGLIKYETGRSHFDFQTIQHPFHYDQDRTHNKWKNDIGLRQVNNELVYNTILDLDDETAIDIINKTVYDYINALTEEKIMEGDLYYNPMKELNRWAQSEGLVWGELENVIEVSKSQKAHNFGTIINILHDRDSNKPFGIKKMRRTSPQSWTIEHNIDKRQLRFSCTEGKRMYKTEKENFPWYSYEEVGFNYHQKEGIPRMCQLLGKYALWMEHRDDAPPLTRISSWEDFIIIGNRKNTIRIYQRLKRHLMELLNLEYPGAFEPKAETIDGKKSIYIEPLINIAPLPKTSDGEPHKDLTVGSNMKFRGGVADFNLVEDFKKDKKLGLDEGVYHGFSDSDIVDNKEK